MGKEFPQTSKTMNQTLIIQIGIVLLLSAFFSGLEIAFVSSNKMLFEMERDERGITTRIIDIFYRHQSNFLSTLLIGNNIALVIYGILMAKVIHNLTPSASDGEVLILQTLIGTVIVLFVGEFLPKALFRINPNRMMRICAIPALIFYYVLWPISRFTSGLSWLILIFMGQKIKANAQDKAFHRADLDNLIQSNINSIQNDEELEDEVKIFQNALDFSSIKVRDCIVPRTEIVATSREAKLEEIRDLFTDNGISKLIIYDEDIDNILGFLHSSELFRLGPTDDWTQCIRPVPIVPETMTAQKLLSIFMTEKRSLAVVVDEFGGTSGIVTMEDLVEEIFGDIEDEHDNTTYIAKQLPSGEYHLSARMEIAKVNELFDLDLPEDDDYLTIGGLILHEYQSFPKLNEVVEFGHWRFKVIKKTATKIEEVLLTKK